MVDEKAQLSVDFLGGFVIVFFSVVTAMHFIPSLFTGLQNPSVDLAPVAYRTGVLLAEDPGWWINFTDYSSGFNWEDNLNNTTRIGLARVKFGKGDPCSLSKNKTLAFIALHNKSSSDTYERIRDLLGLRSSVRNYEYNVTFKTLHGSPWIVNVSGTYMNVTFGREIPASGSVEKAVRIFKIREGDFYIEIPSIYPTGSSDNWWPNWPDGHSFDSNPDDDKGQQDKPAPLNVPVSDFLVYNASTIDNSNVEFEMYITNNSSIDRNLNVISQGEFIVRWYMSPSDENWNKTGDAFDGSKWTWNNDSGAINYDFSGFIQRKIEEKGWNNQNIYIAINFENFRAGVSSSSFTRDTSTPVLWISSVNSRTSIKMEVCVW